MNYPCGHCGANLKVGEPHKADCRIAVELEAARKRREQKKLLCPECKNEYMQYVDDHMCSWCQEKRDKEQGH